MNGKNLLDRFSFDQDTSFDEKVESEWFLSDERFIPYRHHSLGLEFQAAQLQLTAEAPLVDGFDQARTFVAMNFNRCAND